MLKEVCQNQDSNEFHNSFADTNRRLEHSGCNARKSSLDPAPYPIKKGKRSCRRNAQQVSSSPKHLCLSSALEFFVLLSQHQQQSAIPESFHHLDISNHVWLSQPKWCHDGACRPTTTTGQVVEWYPCFCQACRHKTTFVMVYETRSSWCSCATTNGGEAETQSK